jgi:hypothetical protein
MNDSLRFRSLPMRRTGNGARTRFVIDCYSSLGMERERRDPLAGEIIKLNARRAFAICSPSDADAISSRRKARDLLPSPRKLHEIIENQIRPSWKFSLTSHYGAAS